MSNVVAPFSALPIVTKGENGFLIIDFDGQQSRIPFNCVSTAGVATTSMLGIGHTDLEDVTTDHTAALQKALLEHERLVIDTIVGIQGQVFTKHEGQEISCRGIGRLRQLDGPEIKGMLVLNHERCRVDKFKADNPLLLKTTKYGRQGAIEVRRDYCYITNSEFTNQLNAVTGPGDYAPHGTRVINNRFIDCLGVGQEDRGDAVTIWGSGSLIAFNYASCKVGEDARLAFHCEQPIYTPQAPRPELDQMYSLMVGNQAIGSFRRHFALENQYHSFMVDNVSLGGATWWAEVMIQCTNCYARNIIFYDRDRDNVNGASWGVVYGGSCLMNYNTGVRVDSKIFISKKGAGYGFVQEMKNAGNNEFTFGGEIVFENEDSANVGIWMNRPYRAHLQNYKILGATTGIRVILGDGKDIKPFIRDVGGHIECSGQTHLANIGKGGTYLASDGTFITKGMTGADIANADMVDFSTCHFDVGMYPLSCWSTKRVIFKGNASLDPTKEMFFRYAGKTTVSFAGMDIVAENNHGIRSDVYYQKDDFLYTDTPLNTARREPGLMQIGMKAKESNQAFLSMGAKPEDPWMVLPEGNLIVPVPRPVIA